MRAKEFLRELFQPKGHWEWTFRGSEEVAAEFEVGGIPYEFYADNFEGQWELEFKRKDGKDFTSRYGITGSGNSTQVMSVIVDIMRSFLSQYEDNISRLKFSAHEDSRQKLYAKMAKRLLPDWRITQNGGYIYLTPPSNDDQVELNESTYTDHEAQLKHFVKWCVGKLDIKEALPKIRFQDTKEGSDQHRTGYYDGNTDTMWIYTGNRNLIDIMRTVAHELTHRKQHENNMVHGDQAYPGSPIEQQADAMAGYLMKLYGKEHPEIIE